MARFALTLAAIALLTLSGTAYAEDATRIGEAIGLQPTTLRLSGSPGDRLTQEFLATADSSPTVIKVVANNLTSEEGHRIPQAAVGLTATEDEGNGVTSLAITLNSDEVDAGRYEGTVLVAHKQGFEPLATHIEVKDRPWLPLILMLAGVALGMWITNYEAGGKDRDQLLVRRGQLPELDSDPSLPDAWKTRLQKLNATFEHALRAEDWGGATTAITEMEAVWQRWQIDGDAWTDLIDHIEALKEALKESANPLPLSDTLWRELDSLERKLPGTEDPSVIRPELDELRQRVNTYLDCRGVMEALAESVIPTESDASYQALKRRFENANGDTDLATIETEAAALLATISPEDRGGSFAFGDAGADTMTSNHVAGIGTYSRKLPTASRASANLAWLSWTTAIITALSIASAGFYELYVQNPIFGSTPWSDYAAIAAWGIFSETARNTTWSTISKMGGSAPSRES